MKVRALLLAALLLPASAFAQGLINYSYLQGSYEVWTDPDDHRWTLKGSYQFADNFYAFLEDTSGFRHAGAGYYHPLRSNLHLYGQLGLADSDDGFRPVIEGGARWMLDQQLEIRGAVRFITDAYWDPRTGHEDEILFVGEAVYNLNQSTGLVAALAIPTEADGVVLQFGGRFNF